MTGKLSETRSINYKFSKMPELPEVTTTVSGLNKVLKNLSIDDVWSDWEKLVKFPSFKKFKKDITGKKFIEARRRGKNILIELSGDKTLLVHMKMTGHIMYGKWRKAERLNLLKAEVEPLKHIWTWIPEDGGHLNDPYNRFIHLLFQLSNGHQLVLCDARKFAKVALFDTDKLEDIAYIKELGPEPLKKNMTGATLMIRLMKKPTWPIKQALLNQGLIAGIGNIYSDEILWATGVHPLQKVSTISSAKMKRMFKTMREILQKSIKLGGDSMSDYRNIHGERGGFQKIHNVYRKTGEKCPKKDGGVIRRIKVAGRSSHFCDTHQKLN
ncbi:MAG: bifunctional DNA-formamidopyrimidine glycosylase/DNA-(apurinic or apyrimidinic site) lyase [Candidatus Vogelbacteria bacterium]|nr:bifunctional DNA-formamidopyrimidine glycosylase/DNA-(apurinic or apyrimidinic site) lyase [Candidatus Vogelbacteria bacterium]